MDNTKMTSTFVWATDDGGTIQHQAVLLENDGKKSKIRWMTTGKEKWVLNSNISTKLPSRCRHGGGGTASSSSPAATFQSTSAMKNNNNNTNRPTKKAKREKEMKPEEEEELSKMFLLESISKLPRKDLEKMAISVLKNNVDEEAMSLLKKSYENHKFQQDFFSKTQNIWVGHILPFLGVGNYIFVAGVCKDMKELYQEYFSTLGVDEVPDVYASYRGSYSCDRKALVTDTFYKEAFASLSHAKYWDEVTMQGRRRNRLWNLQICETIARYGNVEVLKWAHNQRKFPWDEETCTEAARAGNMEILKYAHDNGCPWDEGTWYAASESDNREMFEFVKENGCPEPESDSEDDE